MNAFRQYYNVPVVEYELRDLPDEMQARAKKSTHKLEDWMAEAFVAVLSEDCVYSMNEDSPEAVLSKWSGLTIPELREHFRFHEKQWTLYEDREFFA